MYQVSDKVCEEYLQKCSRSGKKVIKNEERLKFILSHPKIRNKLEEWIALPKRNDDDEGDFGSCGNDISLERKASERSDAKKKEGNYLFKTKSYRKSILCYNEALRFTKFSLQNKEENENLALCLGNRSAAYFALGTAQDLQNSLTDISLALKHGYPERLKFKLFLRQANIYLKLDKIEQAKVSFGVASGCKIDSEAERLNLDNLKCKLESVLNLKDVSDKCEEDGTKCCVQIISEFKENMQYEGASACVAIHYSKDKSRYVKCNENLSLGDIVYLENPFASILIPDFYENHCYHCHLALQNDYFFPCCQCSQVKFCQENCLLIAWESYHKHECGSLDLLNSVGVAHLALKVILVAGKKEVLKILELTQDVNNLTSDASIFKKGESFYCRVFSLLDHIEDISGGDLFQYSLTAGLLVNFLLKRTSYFDGDSDDIVYKIGGLILKHICQLICNAHAITYIASDFQNQSVSPVAAEEMQVRIASAIYPSASMMNHSCEPCIASSFTQGNKLVVRVTKDLKKGSEIFNCYGPHARRIRREVRQEALAQQYFFQCDCSSCVKEEEDGYSFVDRFQALKCSTCAGPVIPDLVKGSILVECQDCGKYENIESKIRSALRVDKLITLGTELLDTGKPTDAVTALLEAYRLCGQALYQFHADYGHVCDLLGRCYATLENFDDAARYVKQSVRYVQERFGGSSIEYARELRTLHELMSFSSSSERQMTWIKLAKEKADKILQLYTHS